MRVAGGPRDDVAARGSACVSVGSVAERRAASARRPELERSLAVEHDEDLLLGGVAVRRRALVVRRGADPVQAGAASRPAVRAEQLRRCRRSRPRSSSTLTIVSGRGRARQLRPLAGPASRSNGCAPCRPRPTSATEPVDPDLRQVRSRRGGAAGRTRARRGRRRRRAACAPCRRAVDEAVAGADLVGRAVLPREARSRRGRRRSPPRRRVRARGVEISPGSSWMRRTPTVLRPGRVAEVCPVPPRRAASGRPLGASSQCAIVTAGLWHARRSRRRSGRPPPALRAVAPSRRAHASASRTSARSSASSSLAARAARPRRALDPFQPSGHGRGLRPCARP